MPYTDFPLTFDHKTGKVTITHGFSCVEFLRWCTRQAHSRGRPTMGNSGPGYFLPFMAPYLDMGGAGEHYKAESNFAGLKEVRAQMHQKPLSYLKNKELKDPAKAESVMNRLLLYACYPGSESVAQMKAQRHLYRGYIPLYNALGAAGWEPVPYARVEKAENAWCERFGNHRRGFFFAVRNHAAEARDLSLRIDLKALGIEKAAFASITGCEIKKAEGGRVSLAVPAKWTAVVAVNRPDAKALAEAHQRRLKEKK